jgi:hypothetical protein
LAVLVWLSALTVLIGGCASMLPRHPVPSAALAETADVLSIEGVRAWGDEIPTDIAAEFRKRMPSLQSIGGSATVAKGKRLVEILAMSGGGSNGAYGAGVLAGWTERGDRPEFEIVTGVSSGALVAPFAFLGPAYDRKLKEIWTQYDTSKLITPMILSGILGGAAIADTKPLAALIARYIDRRVMAEIAQQYRRGRVLMVGTTNLDAQRPVVWNIGEIALQDSDAALELIHKVILASASIPGVFPPVEINVNVGGKTYEEVHVDGGTTRQVFASPLNIPLSAYNRFYPSPPKRRVYVINNGYLTPEYRPVSEKTLQIAGRSINTLLFQQGKNDIYRIYRLVQDDGGEFHLTAIPDGFQARQREIFDPKFQAALYEAGYAIGLSREPWMRMPADLIPGRPPYREVPLNAEGRAIVADTDWFNFSSPPSGGN